ncbi:hypothetical protein HIM_08263 [Hirsutella minnesotensis 3608]|uniref:O-methylsterigmatocystin oxidoreductase n=1 Tax=Hirsutella minnesotensis 3608 TaxID=1043627 RepID=A0A0F7ZYE6_9HYPO|nr:hypothetical protein HIM_08263 [Hirsutella minnesotensis 3608]
MASLLLQGLFLVICAYLVYRYRLQKKALVGLPPGPRPLPFVGNVLDLPPKGGPEFRHWLKHKDIYGPISSVTVLGNTLIFMHGRDAAREVLEKSAPKSSGRPTLCYAVRACGYNKFLPFLQNDDNHVRGRKAIHQQMNTPAAGARASATQHIEVRRFLKRVLDQPDDLRQHLWGLATAIILKLTYGYSVERSNPDPLVKLIEVESKNFATIAVPMAWLVDVFPVLDYLPARFPGAGFKQTAKKWKALLEQAVDIPYNFVVEQRKRQSQRPSFVSGLLEEAFQEGKGDASGLSSEEENFIKWTATTLYGASSGTTVATFEAFVAAMVMFPEVQKKAQEEIDRVIGSERLPNHSDRDQLPYLDALTKEVSRWSPVTPMGAAHLAQEEMSCSGYRIPKGAFLLPAVWWFCHDPVVYPDPDDFEPARYLHPRNEPDPRTVTFGFGRRVCAGQNFAEATTFIAFSAILAVFRLSRGVDENGKELDIEFDHNPGVICHPRPYPYRIEARSAAHAELIRSVDIEHPVEESDAGSLDLSNVKYD